MNKIAFLLFSALLFTGCTLPFPSSNPDDSNQAPECDDALGGDIDEMCVFSDDANEQDEDNQGDESQEDPFSDLVEIYLVMLEDNGAVGQAIGCGDSLVEVPRPQIQNVGDIEGVLTDLFLQGEYYGQSGFYNALHQSSLTVDSVSVSGGNAVVELSGDLVLAGVCDNPRVTAQLEETVLQFDDINSVEIFINGTSLADHLSLQ